MRFKKTLTAAAVCGLFALGNAQAAMPAADLSNLFGNFIPDTDIDGGGPGISHAGYEYIVPFAKVNVGASGYPDSIVIMWKVYAAEDGSLLRTTWGRTLTVANGGLPDPAGCSDTPELNHAFRFAHREDLLNRAGVFTAAAQRAHFGLNLEMNGPGCYGISAVVYSGNLSDVGGAKGGGANSTTTSGYLTGGSWLKTYPGRELIGLNGIDAATTHVDGATNKNVTDSTNPDLVNDALMITTLVDLGPTGDNVVIQFVQGGNGSDYDQDNDSATNNAWTQRVAPLDRSFVP